MSDFKLCKQAGLNPVSGDLVRAMAPSYARWVSAEVVEELLTNAPVVESITDLKSGNWLRPTKGSDATHTARLVCIQEIKRESEEIRLLRELIKWRDTPHDNVIGPNVIATKAEAFLARLDGSEK